MNNVKMYFVSFTTTVTATTCKMDNWFFWVFNKQDVSEIHGRVCRGILCV